MLIDPIAHAWQAIHGTPLPALLVPTGRKGAGDPEERQEGEGSRQRQGAGTRRLFGAAIEPQPARSHEERLAARAAADALDPTRIKKREYFRRYAARRRAALAAAG